MRKLLHEEISARRHRGEALESLDRFPIYGLLDNIRSLYNVGSMFRTADGARLGRLYLAGYTPHPPRREIEKTALGATATVPWEYHRSPLDAVEAVKRSGARLCVLEQTDASRPHYRLRREDLPLCIVVGNEISGVSREFLAAADCAVEIPMYGMKQSLNAAVAFGIAVFELVKLYREGA
jgi:tRNA G18 (ribose-2'-O)-methylase SpoU